MLLTSTRKTTSCGVPAGMCVGPLIAQHRFVRITSQAVEFSIKDLKEKRIVKTQYSLPDFIIKLLEHVPDHYRHAIRYGTLMRYMLRAEKT
jgi:Putative transposase